MKRRSGDKGVTLTELLVVLAVVGIFALVTIPAFRDFMNAFKAKSTASQIRDVFRLGRQIAVAQKGRVTALVNTGVDSYDAWLDQNTNGIKDSGEQSIRPVPDVPQWVDVKTVYSNLGEISGDTFTFRLNSDGTLGRDGCADPCSETRWCVEVEMPINSRRTDHWFVYMVDTGKFSLEFDKDTGASDFCKW